MFKEIFEQLNIFAQCRRYGLSAWQCPQFLFPVMGLIIITSSIVLYAIGARYISEPLLVALAVIATTFVLLIISFIITHSFERLAEVSRMKSEFISIVSHQLRSPLSNLKWALELLISGRVGKIEAKQTEYFQILKENVVRMGELVSDLLTVSRIETATLAFEKKEISFVELMKDVIAGFKPIIDASNVKIEFLAPEILPRVLLDPSQVKLAVENLLDNAIRYCKVEKEGGRVEIVVKEKNNALYCEIRDNGVGIPKKDQKYIFEKFFRAENVLRYQTQGSGLGLYIAKAIVKRSGGKIGFRSEQGKGTTFWLTFPIIS